MNFSIKISELKTIFVILLYNILLFTPVVTMGVDTSIVPQLQRVTIKTDSVIYEDNSPLDETTQNSNYFPVIFRYLFSKILARSITSS
jgi:hypothetical protein